MQQFILEHQWIIYALIAWTLPWKGMALWRAAAQKQRKWFVVLFLINTAAILDILYLIYFSKIEENNDETPQQTGPTILSNGKRVV